MTEMVLFDRRSMRADCSSTPRRRPLAHGCRCGGRVARHSRRANRELGLALSRR